MRRVATLIMKSMKRCVFFSACVYGLCLKAIEWIVSSFHYGTGRIMEIRMGSLASSLGVCGRDLKSRFSIESTGGRSNNFERMEFAYNENVCVIDLALEDDAY